MIHPDPELFGNRKKDYDDIIIEISSNPEGDVFISDTMMDFYAQTDATPAELDMYMDMADTVREKYNFAILFKNVIGSSLWVCNDVLEENSIDAQNVQSAILEDFMTKYIYIIDWLWDLVMYYKIWAPIRFVGSLIATIVSKKKTK